MGRCWGWLIRNGLVTHHCEGAERRYGRERGLGGRGPEGGEATGQRREGGEAGRGQVPRHIFGKAGILSLSTSRAAGAGILLQSSACPLSGLRISLSISTQLTQWASKGQLFTSCYLASLQAKHYQAHLTAEKSELQREVAICENR